MNPTNAPVPFFAKLTQGRALVVRSGVQAGAREAEYKKESQLK